MRMTMFKLPRHRVFHHMPIYYNPEKEKQMEREQRIKQEYGHIIPDYSAAGIDLRIRGRMRHHRKAHTETIRKERIKSNIRLLIIIGLLSLMALYLFFSSSEWLQLMNR